MSVTSWATRPRVSSVAESDVAATALKAGSTSTQPGRSLPPSNAPRTPIPATRDLRYRRLATRRILPKGKPPVFTTSTSRPRRIRRRVTSAAAAATVLATALTAIPAADAAVIPAPCAALAVAPPIALPATTAPAAAVLRRLAGNLTTVPADFQTGRYTKLSLRMSAADSSIGDCMTTETDVAAETRWRDETTDSGRITGTPWHPAADVAPEPVATWYRPGELPGVLPGRVPTDPARLAAALDAAYPPDTLTARAHRHARALPVGIRRTPAGTAHRVEAVADLVTWHDTPPAARRAILLVLAAVPGLLSHGTVTVDGRTGIAVSIADATITQVLIIDAASGEIVATEHVLTDPLIGRNLAVTVPYSLSRDVITGRGRTNHPTVR